MIGNVIQTHRESQGWLSISVLRRRPQPKHKKQKKSQHDKRKRLQRRNPKRKKTTHARVPLTGTIQTAVSLLQAVMDRRIAFRLAIVVAGMFLADDRRTASAWFVAAGVQDDWDRFYDCLISVGRTSGKLATVILGLVVQKFAPGLGDRILLGMDDSPTSRYGRHVEGAGVHHNPTRGPADGEWLYGHNWVALAWLARHPAWGVIAFPLRSMLYVREVDVPKLAEKYAWEFRTKHQLGVELLTWFMQSIRELGVEAKVWLAVDGAYATRPFLLPVLGLDIVVVSRLRKDACLYDLPDHPSSPPRAHPIYGKNKISLAKRAAHRQGWQTITYHCRGVEVTRQYKTFLATSRLVSGQIRVVIVRFEDGGWAPYFCTDTSADVRDDLGSRGLTLGDRRTLPRREGGLGRGAATSSQRLVEPWLLALEPVAVRVGRVVLLGHGPIRVDRPPSASLGQPRPSSLACRPPPLDCP